MKFHHSLALATIAAIGVTIFGCSDDTNNTTTSSGSSSSTSSGESSSSSSSSSSSGGTMMMPALGTQIDRFGRPAINTALNKTFETDATKKDMGKDEYNANSDPSTWAAKYVPEFEANLAILDSLDTVCGNQLLADKSKNDPSRYATLAGVLVDDRLYVKLEATACTTYLGVEADAVGVKNDDCGGRTLAYDVIDASYTALATGALDGSVGDKIPISDPAKGTTFPYLAAPQ